MSQDDDNLKAATEEWLAFSRCMAADGLRFHHPNGEIEVVVILDYIMGRLMKAEECEKKLARIAERLSKAMTRVPEGPFICGTAGEPGVDELPEFLMVCPQPGLDGFAVYQKHRDYGGPEW